MKKFKVGILFLLLLFVTNNLTAQWAGNGTQTSPYLIKDSADLLSLSKYVNKGNSTTGKYFRLEKDIDMANVLNYVPIGGWDTAGTYSSTTRPFSGSFDGNGKLIKNLSISRDTTANSLQDRIGLFGYIGEGAIIKNVGVVNASMRGSLVIGIICGYSKYATIRNCYTSGKVSGWDACGGICGLADNSIIESSYSKADINGYNKIGGIAGIIGVTTIKNSFFIGSTKGTTLV
ncbi:MAG: Fibronectin type domain protein, partial [Bacteroidetes bacterium]|nr:Fibronectin type domain protein [Bacteroidota bacterium]